MSYGIISINNVDLMRSFEIFFLITDYKKHVYPPETRVVYFKT